jgi:spore maturation protein CgeB
LRLFLLGKRASVTHWLEDAAAAFAAEHHAVAVGLVRRPWLAAGIETSLVSPIAASLRRRIARFGPDLILALGAFHVPDEILEAVASLPGRPPIVGWVGDAFGVEDHGLAARYDAIGYADSGLLARHQAEGFASRAVFLPHAANPAGAWPMSASRASRMVFVANPTPERRRWVATITEPVVLHGPGWGRRDGAHHDIHARRVPPRALRGIYGVHLAALNIRNERNVLRGLNQRNFDPLLAGAALLTDDQPDLERCFDPGTEVLVWRDAESLNDQHRRLLADPTAAARLARRGRRRVLADHTYARRLETIIGLL